MRTIAAGPITGPESIKGSGISVQRYSMEEFLARPASSEKNVDQFSRVGENKNETIRSPETATKGPSIESLIGTDPLSWSQKILRSLEVLGRHFSPAGILERLKRHPIFKKRDPSNPLELASYVREKTASVSDKITVYNKIFRFSGKDTIAQLV